jgi:methyltransferase FkbM-like protein
VSIPTLLERFSVPFVDVLKVDIEGAEESVFLANPDAWLDRVGLILIELHGPAAERAVVSALERSGFARKRYRSIWCCERERPV